MDVELVEMWEGVVMVCFKVMFKNLPTETAESEYFIILSNLARNQTEYVMNIYQLY
jgi:hypothetical protein